MNLMHPQREHNKGSDADTCAIKRLLTIEQDLDRPTLTISELINILNEHIVDIRRKEANGIDTGLCDFPETVHEFWREESSSEGNFLDVPLEALSDARFYDDERITVYLELVIREFLRMYLSKKDIDLVFTDYFVTPNNAKECPPILKGNFDSFNVVLSYADVEQSDERKLYLVCTPAVSCFAFGRNFIPFEKIIDVMWVKPVSLALRFNKEKKSEHLFIETNNANNHEIVDDFYRDISNDDGEDVYLNDGVYMRPNGSTYDTRK